MTATESRTERRAAEVRAAKLAGPLWRRGRLWLGIAALVVAGALGIAALTSAPGTPLDPSSPAHGGSEALAVLLQQRGTSITRATSLAAAVDSPASSTVLVTAPDDLSADQLQQLTAAGHRLVVIAPDPSSLAALPGNVQLQATPPTGTVAPGCDWPGAVAATTLEVPDFVEAFSSPQPGASCYGGTVIVTDSLVLLGAPDLLRNDRLATSNTAAVDINAISADGTVAHVVWLLPGVEDAGSGSPNVWDLFPPFVHRAFWWLVFVGLLLLLWRGRRLGPVVAEPLPVVVRSAEVVEGHGRLYRRAVARERAAAILRAATVARLARHAGLPRGSSAPQVTALLSAQGGDGARIAAVLMGSVPEDDEGLLRLARELAELEAALTAAGGGRDD